MQPNANDRLRNPWLGILIFGSDFWDTHRKRNSDSVFDSKDSGRIFFLKFRCLDSQKIGIPSLIFGIPVISLRRNSVCVIVANLY
jgi:hypothetical protein